MSEMDYLYQMQKEMMLLNPSLMPLVRRLVEEEMARVRSKIPAKHTEKLPEPMGGLKKAEYKIYVPVKEHPDYNFVGRILGPRGMTAKELERDTGCKIMIRGKGSMRNSDKEMLKMLPNYEHLDDELHVLIQCGYICSCRERVNIKIENAVDQVQKLLAPPKDTTDELKRKQLTELAILNGTAKRARMIQQNHSVSYNETSSGGTSTSTSNGSPSPYVPPASRRSQVQMEFSAPLPQLAYFQTPPPMPYCLSPPNGDPSQVQMEFSASPHQLAYFPTPPMPMMPK